MAVNRVRPTRYSLALLVLAASLTAYPNLVAADPAALMWQFDTDAPDSLPSDFQIGTLYDGRPAGEWQIIDTEKARSGRHVLAQRQGKGAEHAYKLVLIRGTDSSNAELTVSFLAIDGKADMGGGLIWRASDDRNYYLTRANPLEQNIRIYRVVRGVRQMLQNFNQIIDTRKWHTLRVKTAGCRFQVFFDDAPVLNICDKTFTEGRVGLWTKSDAVTYFDDLQLTK